MDVYGEKCSLGVFGESEDGAFDGDGRGWGDVRDVRDVRDMRDMRDMRDGRVVACYGGSVVVNDDSDDGGRMVKAMSVRCLPATEMLKTAVLILQLLFCMTSSAFAYGHA